MQPFTRLTALVAPLDRPNVDTDQIIPKQFLKRIERTGFGEFCFNDWRYRPDGTLNPDFELNAPQYQGAGILVAGRNFGCGSSREHAPSAILGCGVKVVIARSFARIFYRNAVNIGLPVLICEEAVLASADGQQIEVDLSAGHIHNLTTGETFQAEPLDPFVARIVAAGGIIEYIRQEGTLR